MPLLEIQKQLRAFAEENGYLTEEVMVYLTKALSVLDRMKWKCLPLEEPLDIPFFTNPAIKLLDGAEVALSVVSFLFPPYHVLEPKLGKREYQEIIVQFGRSLVTKMDRLRCPRVYCCELVTEDYEDTPDVDKHESVMWVSSTKCRYFGGNLALGLPADNADVHYDYRVAKRSQFRAGLTQAPTLRGESGPRFYERHHSSIELAICDWEGLGEGRALESPSKTASASLRRYIQKGRHDSIYHPDVDECRRVTEPASQFPVKAGQPSRFLHDKTSTPWGSGDCAECTATMRMANVESFKEWTSLAVRQSGSEIKAWQYSEARVAVGYIIGVTTARKSRSVPWKDHVRMISQHPNFLSHSIDSPDVFPQRHFFPRSPTRSSLYFSQSLTSSKTSLIFHILATASPTTTKNDIDNQLTTSQHWSPHHTSFKFGPAFSRTTMESARQASGIFLTGDPFSSAPRFVKFDKSHAGHVETTLPHSSTKKDPRSSGRISKERRDYQELRRRCIPLPESDSAEFAKLIASLWPSLTPVLRVDSYNSSSPYEPDILLFHTNDGLYEYVAPESQDRDPLGPFIRQVFDDGTQGPWVEGTVSREMFEAERKENETATRESIRWMEERRKSGVMTKPKLHLRLQWMEGLVAEDDILHLGQFWLASRTPAVRSEEQRSLFLKEWREHVRACQYFDRRCH
ncbi:hypothetical protein BJ508DRAFT_338662 [Ascobolus immersus RN42]|uniref:Uncharacterized protein n=1 Tax=Ascobolus immersus RN42 TaxID=1160509 RepID=A0A3N4HU82_ASCIM|nr:hypothetical protein BJ508DRAFT_338662 [Ascobolus immersus RN42]